MKHQTTIRRILVPNEVSSDPIMIEITHAAAGSLKRKVKNCRVLEHGRPSWPPVGR